MPKPPFPAPVVSISQPPSLTCRPRGTRQTTERPTLV